MLDVVFGQASDAGRVRPHNEDAAGSFTPKSRQESRSRKGLLVFSGPIGEQYHVQSEPGSRGQEAEDHGIGGLGSDQGQPHSLLQN